MTMILNLVLLLLLAHSLQFLRSPKMMIGAVLIITTTLSGIQTTFPKMELLSPYHKMSLSSPNVLHIRKLVHGMLCFPKPQDAPPRQKTISMLKTLTHRLSRVILLELLLALSQLVSLQRTPFIVIHRT
jgi:hypothetical protein